MTTLDAARARPKAFWADARFFLGIILIAASVAGVWFIVAAARQTAPVYAAARTIVPGDVVSEESLRLVDVALGSSRDAYLTPGAFGEGLVASRTIAEGELVPTAAVADAAGTRSTSVVVQSTTDVPASLDAGSVVEVWSATPLDDGGFGRPAILVADATVVSVTHDDSMIGGGAASLELVIPRADVSATLAAIADGAAISVVPGAATR